MNSYLLKVHLAAIFYGDNEDAAAAVPLLTSRPELIRGIEISRLAESAYLPGAISLDDLQPKIAERQVSKLRPPPIDGVIAVKYTGPYMSAVTDFILLAERAGLHILLFSASETVGIVTFPIDGFEKVHAATKVDLDAYLAPGTQ